MKYEQIALTMIVCALILWVQHWGIAQVVRKVFHPVVNYMLGVLGMVIPLGWLFWEWGSVDELLALLAVVLVSGVAVMLAYWMDHLADLVHGAAVERTLRKEAEERERAALGGLRHAAGLDHVQE